MENHLIEKLADELHGALLARKPSAPLTERHLDLEVYDAYRIQQHMIGKHRDVQHGLHYF